MLLMSEGKTRQKSVLLWAKLATVNRRKKLNPERFKKRFECVVKIRITTSYVASIRNKFSTTKSNYRKHLHEKRHNKKTLYSTVRKPKNLISNQSKTNDFNQAVRVMTWLNAGRRWWTYKKSHSMNEKATICQAHVTAPQVPVYSTSPLYPVSF